MYKITVKVVSSTIYFKIINSIAHEPLKKFMWQVHKTYSRAEKLHAPVNLRRLKQFPNSTDVR